MIRSVIGFKSGTGLREKHGIDCDGLNDLNDWNGLNEMVQTVQKVQIVQAVLEEP